MQEEQGEYFSKCFLIKTKKRSTHQSLTWASQTAGHWDVELAWGYAVFLHISGALAQTMVLLGEHSACQAAAALCWADFSCGDGNFILQPRLFFQQTEVPETGEETISTNLHFPSTSGEDSALFLLPPPGGLHRFIWRLIFGNSHTGRTRFCFCWSQSMSFPRPNCSCTRAHDREPVVL